MICLALTQLFHTLLCSCFEVKQPKKFGFCASQGMHRPREDSEHSETSARQSGKRFHVHILSCSIGLASEGTFGRLMKTGPVRVRVRRSGYRTACHLFQSPLLGSALKGKLGAGLGATCYIGTYFG